MHDSPGVRAPCPPPCCIDDGNKAQVDVHFLDDSEQAEADRRSIDECEQKLAVLRLQLSELGGKANKQERQSVNKEIYRLENSETYVDAARRRLERERAEKAIEDATHEEEQAAVKRRELQLAATAKPAVRGARFASRTAEQHFRQQVEALFDEYAPEFERALCQGLHYRTPEIIRQALIDRPDRRPVDVEEGVLSRLDALDFGCGTGLMGVQLRPHCRGRLLGCDLSRGMLRVATGKHPSTYDELEAADAVSFLRGRAASSSDLIVGADVCNYMRSLEDLVAAAEVALCEGGILAFTTETCRLDDLPGGLPPAGDGFVELASERIAHCPEYVDWVVSGCGGARVSELELLTLEEFDLRMDAGKMVRGTLAVVMKKSQSAG